MIKKKNYTFKVFKKGLVVDRYSSHSARAFFRRLRSINFSADVENVYLRVSYGRAQDIRGVTSTDYNEGFYDSQQELQEAIDAFTEREVPG